jgi:hypothetical protein
MATKYARLAWNNYIDSAISLTATSEAGNMVVDNVQNVELSLPWRSTSTVIQEIEFDLGSYYLINYLYISGHNIQGASKIRLILATDAALSNRVIDREWGALLPIYGLGEGLLGITPLGGYVTNSWVPVFTLKWLDTVVARYGKIIIDDTSNADGYIQIGRIKLGEYYEFPYLQYGYSTQFIPIAKQTLVASGNLRGERKELPREVAINFSFLPYEGEKLVNDMEYYARRDKDVLFCAFPERNTTEELEHTFNGLLTETSGKTRENLPFRTFSFKIREIR